MHCLQLEIFFKKFGIELLDVFGSVLFGLIRLTAENWSEKNLIETTSVIVRFHWNCQGNAVMSYSA